MNLDPSYSWFGRTEWKQRRTWFKKKNPKFEQILEMASKRQDQLKYQTSYILKARRQTKTFVLLWAKASRIPPKQNFLGSKIRSLLRVFLLQNKATTFSSVSFSWVLFNACNVEGNHHFN